MIRSQRRRPTVNERVRLRDRELLSGYWIPRQRGFDRDLSGHANSLRPVRYEGAGLPDIAWDTSRWGVALNINTGDTTGSGLQMDYPITIPAADSFTILCQFSTTDDFGPVFAMRSSVAATQQFSLYVGDNGIDTAAAGNLMGVIQEDSGVAASIDTGVAVNTGEVIWAGIRRRKAGANIITETIHATESARTPVPNVMLNEAAGSSDAITCTADHCAFGCDPRWVTDATLTAEKRALDATFYQIWVATFDMPNQMVQRLVNEPYYMLEAA